ncbi:hypothetical protein [uncultured Endozoicomonas sp.]|uniref:hypothetical protein n=1 Tax=uncultured Endozoicomonas sp. TaxID=432652 RepID=UPI002609B75D|nr:hypothetical protein [uncultured Endozoicomonas sp.]
MAEPIEQTPLQVAIELVNTQPWPEDIADRLEQLEAKATGEDKDHFGDVWESYIVLGGE